MKRDDIIKEKLDYYFSAKVKVHISKFNKEFLNGYIKNKSDTTYLMEEDYLGLITIFVSEVFDVEEFKAHE